jgi:hypothetical protein
MKWFFKSKDGGPESNVTGYWLFECKSVFSIVLLRFDKGSREKYHNHAFHAVSWILSGSLKEKVLHKYHAHIEKLYPSILPIFTSRNRLHKVFGVAEKTWVLSFRGPWTTYWKEYSTETGKFTTLTNGRKIVDG